MRGKRELVSLHMGFTLVFHPCFIFTMSSNSTSAWAARGCGMASEFQTEFQTKTRGFSYMHVLYVEFVCVCVWLCGQLAALFWVCTLNGSYTLFSKSPIIKQWFSGFGVKHSLLDRVWTVNPGGEWNNTCASKNSQKIIALPDAWVLGLKTKSINDGGVHAGCCEAQ